MDQNTLLGSSFVCDCGKKHSVPTKEMIYSRDCCDTLLQTALAMPSSTRYLIIADTRTYEAAAKSVFERLRNKALSISLFIVPDHNGESPVADTATRDLIINEAPEADVYIAVGSGVINDLVKWAAYLGKKTYFTIPTAASMNGYASANVAATVDGLKVLFHADAPSMVFADPDILRNAPYELTASGLGDVLAKSISSADWKLNHFLFNDYYCRFSVDLLKELEPVYLNNPERIKALHPEALQALFEALFYSSIAMTITGTSSPASGAEHLISHTLDMTADRDGRKHDLHGRQVGVASILMAALYEKIMSIETPHFTSAPENITTDFWGSLAPVVAKQYAGKKQRMDLAVRCLSDQKNWQKLKELITPDLIAPARLKNCLAGAEGAHCFHHIRDNGTPLLRERFINVVHNAHQMRERFTILDLAVLLGVIPGETEELVDRWVTS
ncbi:MAG: iron-containing alcohol dehydrogenase [Desulfopila sp.]|nr:iron-containing alcohol dehydrogenase [Desulfopila sp.]